MKVDGLDVPAHRFLSLPGLIMGNSPGRYLHVRLGAAVRARAGADHRADRRRDRDCQAGAGGLPAARSRARRSRTRPIPRTPIRSPTSGRRMLRCGSTRASCCSIAAPTRSTPPAGPAPSCHFSHGPGCASTVPSAFDAASRRSRSCSPRQARPASAARSPLARALADLKAINNHGLLQLEMNHEMYGRLLMGLEPNTPLI